MKSRSLLILAIASIMSISIADAHPVAAQNSASIKTYRHHNRGKMARMRAHRMRPHVVGRPFMRKMRTPRVGVSIIF